MTVSSGSSASAISIVYVGLGVITIAVLRRMSRAFAAGGAEAVFSVLSLYNQVVPPTINLENPDPDCDLDYVPKTSREMKLDVVLSNSFGFGGTNGTLVLKRV